MACTPPAKDEMPPEVGEDTAEAGALTSEQGMAKSLECEEVGRHRLEAGCHRLPEHEAAARGVRWMRRSNRLQIAINSGTATGPCDKAAMKLRASRGTPVSATSGELYAYDIC